MMIWGTDRVFSEEVFAVSFPPYWCLLVVHALSALQIPAHGRQHTGAGAPGADQQVQQEVQFLIFQN